ncbi:MAG: hypothetical protein WBB98_02355 [Xanthobacteraceae bacterium]
MDEVIAALSEQIDAFTSAEGSWRTEVIDHGVLIPRHVSAIFGAFAAKILPRRIGNFHLTGDSPVK